MANEHLIPKWDAKGIRVFHPDAGGRGAIVGLNNATPELIAAVKAGTPFNFATNTPIGGKKTSASWESGVEKQFETGQTILGWGDPGYTGTPKGFMGSSTPNQNVPQGGASSPSTTSSTGAAPKPFGLENITSTLNAGSQSTQVKELQKYLAANGYVGTDGKPLKEDGVYGPQTKAAVMQFQQKNGLAVDGVFGPRSLAKANNIASTNTQINSAPPGSNPTPQYNTDNPNAGGTTFNTGDPANDAILQELQNFIKVQQDAGLKLNAALNFDAATLAKFLETAKKQVHPYYKTQIDNIKADVIRSAPQILANYESDIKNKEANFQGNLDNSRESNADRGLAFSGGRAKGELGALDAQNRDLASIGQTYGNKLYDLGRGAEEKIGSSNANYNLGALTNYSANLGGNGGFSLGSSSSPYTSGSIGTGSLQYDQEQATEARRQALLKSASESVVAGRSYNDLFA